MSDFSDRIIELLRASPDGLTSNDIAARLGTTGGNLSSRLSKLAAYGIIGRVRRPLDRNGPRATVYQLQAINHARPPAGEESI
jgi:DNA-binding MarR family transcriptional regulator